MNMGKPKYTEMTPEEILGEMLDEDAWITSLQRVQLETVQAELARLQRLEAALLRGCSKEDVASYLREMADDEDEHDRPAISWWLHGIANALEAKP